MKKFARIIELKDGRQMLFTVNYNTDDDNHELTICFEHEGVRLTTSLGFKTEKSTHKEMNDFTLERAEKFRAGILEMLIGK